MELAKSFEPAEIEKRWYAHWESAGYFKAGEAPDADANAYCIMLPPPNVTGSAAHGPRLPEHPDGRAQSATTACRATNTLWLPGTDHAGIATQIVVERELRRRGRSPATTSAARRSSKRSGSGRNSTAAPSPARCAGWAPRCDWSRERFTMDEGLSKAVTEVFVRLYEQGPHLPRQAAGELGPGARTPRCPTSRW